MRPAALHCSVRAGVVHLSPADPFQGGGEGAPLHAAYNDHFAGHNHDLRSDDDVLSDSEYRSGRMTSWVGVVHPPLKRAGRVAFTSTRPPRGLVIGMAQTS